MDLSAVITQLRTYCTALKFVGGAADFANGLESTVNPASMPAAYVVPIADDADDNQLQNGLLQEVRERLAVIVEFDNSLDRRGQLSANQVEAMRFSIFSAILNWRIDSDRAQRGIQYAGSRFLEMDRARMWWQYEFELTVTIDDDDGFQVPSVDLVDIRVDIDVNPVTPPVTPPTPVEVDVFLHPPLP